MPASVRNLVNLESVTKTYGTATPLDAVSLGVAAAERIGVVGRNGSGKTTLLRILTRADQPDSGRVAHASGLRIGLLSQSTDLPAGTARDAVLAGYGAEHEWAGDASVRAVLDGLGLYGVGLDAPVDRLSGGERRRVALAGLLIRPTDLLVLDEPTNHLDVEGIAWLADHLTARKGALVVVTHDRWFLDAVCQTTWEVADGAVHQYDGGYAAYTLARAERARRAGVAEERRRNLLRKELAWLRRGAPARTSKPKFRIEAAQALIEGEPPPRDPEALRAFATHRLGRIVYEVEDATVAVGDRTLLEHLTWRVGPGDRIGLVGVNGAGKTSLLRLLVGELTPTAGRVRVGRSVRAAYLSQEVVELPEGDRVLEAAERAGSVVRYGKTELSAAALLERFGFDRSRQWTPVADLSGGERRRLRLLTLLMGEPNVLLLDEPTNDLDTDTLAALEDLLDSWPGSLIVVSHDRYLVERVCDTVLALLGDGRLAHLPGGVEEYLNRRALARDPAREPRAPKARSAAADRRAATKELARLERRVATLERREADLRAELERVVSDYQRAAELDRELREVSAEKESTETAWLELADGL